MDRVLFPRLHLAEIEDQTWCPSWLRQHSHRALARAWSLALSPRGPAAVQACEILIAQLGGLPSAAQYTFIDACAGAGGPTPLLERHLNERLRAEGLPAVRFVLADLWPDVDAWKKIAAQSEYIDYIAAPRDAMRAQRMMGKDEDGLKECRIFNLSFHHFDDGPAEKVVKAAVEGADAFM